MKTAGKPRTHSPAPEQRDRLKCTVMSGATALSRPSFVHRFSSLYFAST